MNLIMSLKQVQQLSDPKDKPITLEVLLSSRPDLFLTGLLQVAQGYLLVSIIFSSLYLYLSERNFRNAANWCLLASFLACFGFIHSYAVNGNSVSSVVGFLATPESIRYTYMSKKIFFESNDVLTNSRWRK